MPAYDPENIFARILRGADDATWVATGRVLLRAMRRADPQVCLSIGGAGNLLAAQDILDELNWGTAPSQPLPDLPPEQAKVLKALTGPATLDDLQVGTGLSLPELQTALVMLQLLGLVEEIGGRWARR